MFLVCESIHMSLVEQASMVMSLASITPDFSALYPTS